MKALVYTASTPRYLLVRALGKRAPLRLLSLRLREVPEPEAPPGWEKAKVLLCGICGSDIALLFGKSSPRLAPFFSFPAVLGHEIVAEVQGTRAVVNPLIACRERGLPLCPACEAGDEALCQNVAEGEIPPGMLGYCRALPGGWTETIAVHPNQVFPVPSDVPNERAVLAEPLSVVLRGLRILQPDPNATVLVIGAGTIGLLSLVALRLLGHAGEIWIVARHRIQAEMATALGATQVYSDPWAAAKSFGAKSYRPPIGPPAWRGGVPYVIDAAGTKTSVDQALWTVAEGGKILLLGAPGATKLDLSPLWFRGIQISSTYTYGRKDFQKAVDLLPEAKGIEKMVTHSFPLPDFRAALKTVLTRRGLKVTFRP